MSESVLTLILRLKKQGANAVKETADDLKGLTKGMADVKASFDMASQAAEKIGQVLRVTVGAAIEWGDAMGDLAQLTGTSVKETSELAATLELLGIKQDGLTKIVKAFTAQGLQPTMANIKALAAEYQAIQDPVAKNEFLFKRFGKQAADVAEIFGKTTEELDYFTAAARRSGKVVGEEAAAQAEKLGVELAILKQQVEGAGISLGNALIPLLNRYFEVTEQTTEALKRENAVGLEAALAHGAQRVELERLALESETLREQNRLLGEQETETTAAADILTRSMTALAAETGRWAGLAAQYAEDEALKKRLEDLTGAASDLKFGMGELTREMLFNQAAAGLDSEAAYNLAKGMGLINPAADAAKGILDELRKQYETGAITAGQYQGNVKLLADAIGTLPEGKTITVTYLEQYTKEFNNDLGTGSQQNRRQGGAIGDGIGGASGLDFVVPAGYPNDSFGPIWAQSGERVQVTPAGQVTNNMGGVTIYVNGAGDPRAVAHEVSRILAQQARGLAQSGIAYMG